MLWWISLIYWIIISKGVTWYKLYIIYQQSNNLNVLFLKIIYICQPNTYFKSNLIKFQDLPNKPSNGKMPSHALQVPGFVIERHFRKLQNFYACYTLTGQQIDIPKPYPIKTCHVQSNHCPLCLTADTHWSVVNLSLTTSEYITHSCY